MKKAYALFGLLALAGRSHSHEAPAPSLKSLKAKAEQVLNSNDNISAAKNADKVFAYADALTARGDGAEAASMRERGLKLAPWELSQQLELARYYSEKGRKDEAKEKFEMLARFAESDVLREAAARGLGQAPGVWEWGKAEMLEGKGPAIVLCPWGPVQHWVVQRLKEDLEAELGIPVYGMDFGLAVGPYARDAHSRWIEDVKKYFKKEPGFELAMEDNAALEGISKKRIWDNDVFIRLVAVQLKRERQERHAQEILAIEESLKGTGKQWDVNSEIKAMKPAFQPFAREGLVFAALTEIDLFSGDNNYQFSVGKPGRAILSYHRFRAEFNGETPRSERLSGRLKKLALSSIGFGFGVERCTSPSCARAYPNNLEQQDAKDGHLCTQCRRGFAASFSRYGWTKPLPDKPSR